MCRKIRRREKYKEFFFRPEFFRNFFKITTTKKIQMLRRKRKLMTFIKESSTNPFHFFLHLIPPYFNIYYKVADFFPTKKGGVKTSLSWNFYFRRVQKICCSYATITETIRPETTFPRYLIAANGSAGTRSSTQLPAETRQKANVWSERKVAAHVAKNIRMEKRFEERLEKC